MRPRQLIAGATLLVAGGGLAVTTTVGVNEMLNSTHGISRREAVQALSHCALIGGMTVAKTEAVLVSSQPDSGCSEFEKLIDREAKLNKRDIGYARIAGGLAASIVIIGGLTFESTMYENDELRRRLDDANQQILDLIIGPDWDPNEPSVT